MEISMRCNKHHLLRALLVLCAMVSGVAQTAPSALDRRVEHTIKLDQSTGLIQLVLHAGAEGDLDDRCELLGQMFPGSHIMPRMEHVRLLTRTAWRGTMGSFAITV